MFNSANACATLSSYISIRYKIIVSTRTSIDIYKLCLLEQIINIDVRYTLSFSVEYYLFTAIADRLSMRPSIDWGIPCVRSSLPFSCY